MYTHYNKFERWGMEMSTTLQIRLDENLKKEATELYESLGMDLSTAVRVFLKKSIIEKGIPFKVVDDDVGRNALMAIREMQKAAEEAGISEMTLDEINEIIRETREMKKKEG